MDDPAGRYRELESRVAAWASTRDDVRAAIVVGSRARDDHPADAASDLDLLLVVEDQEPYLRDASWLGAIDEVWASMEHRTAGGDPEHLVVFAGGTRVDMVLVRASAAQALSEMQALPEPLCRGMRFLLDRDGLEERTRAVPAAPATHSWPSQDAFERRVHGFWLVALYVAQQLSRGDLWWALSCHAKLMEAILPMIEYHARATRGVDTWHNGRFIAEWADARVVAALPGLWARYDTQDALRALDAAISPFAGSRGTPPPRWASSIQRPPTRICVAPSRRGGSARWRHSRGQRPSTSRYGAWRLPTMAAVTAAAATPSAAQMSATVR